MLQLRVSVFSSFPCHDNMDFFFTVQRVIVADIFNCDFKKEEIALTCSRAIYNNIHAPMDNENMTTD